MHMGQVVAGRQVRWGRSPPPQPGKGQSSPGSPKPLGNVGPRKGEGWGPKSRRSSPEGHWPEGHEVRLR